VTGVLGSHIGLKNGTELAQLLNPYADVATIGSYPTGSVEGILGSGEIKARGNAEAPFSSAPGALSGPLLGKNVTDLDKVIAGNNTYITVRTTAHENGEIQGQILPTNIHVSCLSTMRFVYPPTTTPAASNFGPWAKSTIATMISSVIALVEHDLLRKYAGWEEIEIISFQLHHIFLPFFFHRNVYWFLGTSKTNYHE